MIAHKKLPEKGGEKETILLFLEDPKFVADEVPSEARGCSAERAQIYPDLISEK